MFKVIELIAGVRTLEVLAPSPKLSPLGGSVLSVYVGNIG